MLCPAYLQSTRNRVSIVLGYFTDSSELMRGSKPLDHLPIESVELDPLSRSEEELVEAILKTGYNAVDYGEPELPREDLTWRERALETEPGTEWLTIAHIQPEGADSFVSIKEGRLSKAEIAASIYLADPDLYEYLHDIMFESVTYVRVH